MEKAIADKLIFQYMNKIFGFALNKLRNIDQAQELASDIICEVYSSFLKSDNIANIDGYVYRISRNVYSRYIGNLQKIRQFTSIDEMIPAPEIDDDDLEMQEILRREIGFLSERQRLVIYMHYYNKLSAAEISKKLNISQGTVKWHLSDARSKLKEGINMNINEQNTDINPIIFTDMGHSGGAGPMGDTQDMFDSRLKMNIAWACYHEPKTLPEIARAVGVPQVYIADVLSKLVEYAYIDKLDNTKDPKYRTNMYLIDVRGKFNYNYNGINDKAAEFLCEKYFPEIFRNFENDPDHWGLTCDRNDINFLKYNVVMLALSPLQMFENDWDKLLVKRPDGGSFIATAVVNDDLSIKDQNENIYWSCGFMTRTWDNFDEIDDESDKISVESVSVDCRYSDRNGGWRDNPSEDWAALAKFMKNGKEKISPEEYKRLCDKGYVFEDRVQPATVKITLSKDEDIFNSWCRFAREKITVSDEVKKFAKHMDDVIFEEDKKHFPKHMHEVVKAMSMNHLGAGLMIPRIVEKLLENGELTPLSDIQKKSVFSILFYK